MALLPLTVTVLSSVSLAAANIDTAAIDSLFNAAVVADAAVCQLDKARAACDIQAMSIRAVLAVAVNAHIVQFEGICCIGVS